MAWTVLIRWPSQHRHDPGHYSYAFGTHAEAEAAAGELRKKIKSKAKGSGVVLSVWGREIRLPRARIKIEIARVWQRQASYADRKRGLWYVALNPDGIPHIFRRPPDPRDWPEQWGPYVSESSARAMARRLGPGDEQPFSPSQRARLLASGFGGRSRYGDSPRGAAQREALLEAAHMGQIRPGGRHLLATLRQLEARGLLKRAPGGDRYVITSFGSELVASIRASGRRARTGYTRFVPLSPEELERRLGGLRGRRAR